MAKRRPNPEQQTSDRSTVAGCAQILGPLATRYPAQLDAALTLLRAFAASKVEVPAKRKTARVASTVTEAFSAGPNAPVILR
jgi:hypothetical protein